MASLIGRMAEVHLLRAHLSFVVSFGGLWLQRSECIGRQASDRLDVVLDLGSYLALANE